MEIEQRFGEEVSLRSALP